jgi:hypothetical protein
VHIRRTPDGYPAVQFRTRRAIVLFDAFPRGLTGTIFAPRGGFRRRFVSAMPPVELSYADILVAAIMVAARLK